MPRRVSLLAVAFALLILTASTADATLPGQNGRLLISAQQGPFEIPGSPIYVSHLYRLGQDGSYSEYQLADSTYDPSLSPDGSKLAFVRNPGDQLWLGEVGDLAGATALTSRSNYDGDYRYAPVFAPDGNSIIYVTSWSYKDWFDSELTRISLETGQQTRSEFEIDVWSPDISPDGRLIAFTTGLLSSPEIRLAYEIDGASWRFPSDVPASGPSFSPDGKRIAYTGYVDGVWQVFISKLDGTGTRQLTRGAVTNFSVQYAPDGTKVAYWSGPKKKARIVIRDLRSGSTKRIVPPGTNVRVSEWPRARIFKVLGFGSHRKQLRVKVFGPGVLLVRAGENVIGRRSVSRGGIYLLGLRRKVGRKGRPLRVEVRPVGALPGSVRYPLKG